MGPEQLLGEDSAQARTKIAQQVGISFLQQVQELNSAQTIP